HALKGEAVRRGRLAGPGPIPRREDRPDVVWGDPPPPDRDQRSDDRANHLLQEGVGPNGEHDLPVAALHGKTPDVANARSVDARMATWRRAGPQAARRPTTVSRTGSRTTRSRAPVSTPSTVRTAGSRCAAHPRNAVPS